MKPIFRKIGSVAGAIVSLSSQANAATTPNSLVTPQTPNRGIVQFLQGNLQDALHRRSEWLALLRHVDEQ